MYVFGDYNSIKSSLLNIQLIRCNKKDHPDVECKSDSEIKDFFRDKFILILYNEVRFNQQFYGK